VRASMAGGQTNGPRLRRPRPRPPLLAPHLLRGVERVELAVQVVDLLELVLAVDLEQGEARGRLEEEQHRGGARGGDGGPGGARGTRGGGSRERGGRRSSLSQARRDTRSSALAKRPRAAAEEGGAQHAPPSGVSAGAGGREIGLARATTMEAAG